MGLARFDPRTETFKDYGRSHGLQGNEFNFGAHYRSPRGELFFGGPNGFNAFFAESIPTNDHVPPVVLTAFLNANRPATTDAPPFALEQVRLGHRDDVVTFEFAALDFAAPARNRYVYKLEGFDADWIDLESVHRVTYTDLDPGRYALRVRAANNDGVWNEEGLTLPVTVLPPPWRTWWAYLIYTVLLAGTAARVVQMQRRKANREAEYRRRLELEVEARTEELAHQNDRLESLNAQLVETSLTDSLTGLRNRRYLFEEVGKEMSLVQRHHRERSRGLRDDADQLVFLMIDLDWFKPINDTCGHASGDRVLVQVRHLLEKACRDSDVLIRWGGDEFLVVGRVNDLEGIEAAAERIRSVIESASFDLGDGQVAHITCSVGFTCYPAGTAELLRLSLEQVVGLADKALYAAKKAGRNAWVGLLGTPDASVESVLESLQTEPDALPREGVFEVRRSTDHKMADVATM
jgi:diguanylate cyclase (GGDEF)-like protein